MVFSQDNVFYEVSEISTVCDATEVTYHGDFTSSVNMASMKTNVVFHLVPTFKDKC